MEASQRQHKPGVWTEEEDALLALWQGRVGNKWSEVAKHIPGKTGQQCAQRWRHRVNPNISREKWTAEEDVKLAELVEQHGNSWAEISRRLPGRTDQQCMGRWRRHLDPSIRRESWQPAEDEQLRELYAEYGSSWSCISKSLTGRTAQQCRARWCQLSNAERPSRSGASRSKATSSASKAAAAAGDPDSSAMAAETLLQQQTAAGNPRRQSTANTVGAQQQQLSAAPPGATPAELFAAAQSAAAGGQARHGADRSRQRGGGSAAPAGASRRLSTVSEVGAHNPGWSTESAEYAEEEEEEDDDDSSPEFTVRRTTARTAGRAPGSTRPPRAGSAASAANLAAIDAATATAAMLAAGLPLPRQAHPAQQHSHLQPPAAAAQQQQQQQQGPAFAPAAATAAMAGSRLPVPAVVLPDTLLPLKLGPPATVVGPGPPGRPADEDDDSPALTENPGPHAAATADLLSPLRAPLPSAPPLFTPSSSGRKRTAESRMAAFGPALPPLVIPDLQATAAKGTPLRPTPGTGGSGPLSLELRSPNVLTLLQSPPPMMDDLFRSPGFGTMLTPPWAKSGSSGGSGGSGKTAGGTSGGRRGGAEAEDRRQSVARRLDSGPSFGDQRQQQQQHEAAGLQHAASFDFGLIGSPPKKTRIFSPTASCLTAATAAAAGGGTPWMAGAAAVAAGGLLLQPADSAGGGTSLAMAVQHHLLLASTAKAGPPLGAAAALAAEAGAGGKENSTERRQAAARQATLTAAKPAAPPGGGRGGSPGNELTSSSVRMRLHALLENV